MDVRMTAAASTPATSCRSRQWRGERRWSDATEPASYLSASSSTSQPSKHSSSSSPHQLCSEMSSLSTSTSAAPASPSASPASCSADASSILPAIISDQVNSGGDALGVLLLIEDEFIRVLRRIEALGDRWQDDDHPLLVFPSINSFVRMCIHETARRFRLSTRSMGEGDERRLYVYRTRGTSIPLILFADLIPFSAGRPRQQRLETFCSSTMPLFEAQPNMFYHVCTITADPADKFDTTSSGSLSMDDPDSPAQPLAYDWGSIELDRRDRSGSYRDQQRSLSSSLISSTSSCSGLCRAGISHIVALSFKIAPDEATVKAVLDIAGWTLPGSPGSSLRVATICSELFRSIRNDSGTVIAALLVCPSPSAATAAMPKLMRYCSSAKLLERANIELIDAAGFTRSNAGNRGPRDSGPARRMIQRSLRSRW